MIEMKRMFAEATLAIASGQTASSVLNLYGFAFGSIQLPAAITGTLKWQVSLDGTNWTDGDAISFTANKSLKIPDNVWDFPLARILADTNQAAARSILSFIRA